MSGYDFSGLFVYDMANNHQGDVAHGTRMIREIAKVSNAGGVRGTFKFQFRDIDTLVHPDFRENKEVKHIPRFIETRLTHDDYAILTDEVRENGLITMATPFDEESIELIRKLDIEIVKIASCSASDWPLLDAVAKTRKPVIISTAGLTIDGLDNLVSYFDYHKVDFALMHCVALYPTPVEKLELNQLKTLCTRYPHITIGFSTHEAPDYYHAIRAAYCLGARIFERHVDIPEEGFKMNAYSATPDHIKGWIAAYNETVAACGAGHRHPASCAESASLQSLKRGVYAAKPIKKGAQLARKDVFFAMPLQDNQLDSGIWRENQIADRDYAKNDLVSEVVAQHTFTYDELTNQIIRQAKGMLNEARVTIGQDAKIELSHHYGLERFREFGVILIDCVNREYCKKILVQLPRQKHPYHYHAKKEETFQVLHGSIELEIEGHRKRYYPGETIVVHRGEWHKFQSAHGVIVEEVSTTHFKDDSYYEDKSIACLKLEERKTAIADWHTPSRP